MAGAELRKSVADFRRGPASAGSFPNLCSDWIFYFHGAKVRKSTRLSKSIR